MLDDALNGGFENPPVQSSHAFRAALSALARPGRVERIMGAEAPGLSEAAATLLLTLCDAETPIYLAPGHDSEALGQWIAFHIGAPLVGPSHAMFALGAWDALMPLTGYPVGTPEYPDRATTLIVEVEALTPPTARLTGPGVETVARMRLPETDSFRANRALFPLGHDFFFTAGEQIAGLPRTTIVEDL
jgi:alpha-D-ribose 1-methylphosphonate 5-triphosphate synthase subunit PhnH